MSRLLLLSALLVLRSVAAAAQPAEAEAGEAASAIRDYPAWWDGKASLSALCCGAAAAGRSRKA